MADFSRMNENFMGKPAGWAVSENIAHMLAKEFKNQLHFSVYREYQAIRDVEEYHIVAKHPRTGEIRFRRLVSLRELMTDEGNKLLFTQLYLVIPPT